MGERNDSRGGQGRNPDYNRPDLTIAKVLARCANIALPALQRGEIASITMIPTPSGIRVQLDIDDGKHSQSQVEIAPAPPGGWG